VSFGPLLLAYMDNADSNKGFLDIDQIDARLNPLVIFLDSNTKCSLYHVGSIRFRKPWLKETYCQYLNQRIGEFAN